MINENKNAYLQGFRDGIPIGLGYLAVSFSLGIAASNIGLTPFQGMVTSLLVNASAGQHAGFLAIGENSPYLELIIVTIIANARYILMSFALSQKIPQDTKPLHRFLLGFYLTDEFFGITINRQEKFNPFYTYGAVSIASPLWALGTMLGIIFGNILPANIVSCLSVALYAMFIAIIIPVAKKDKAVTILIIISFVASYLVNYFFDLSSGITVIVLTLIICTLGAIIFPIKEDINNE